MEHNELRKRDTPLDPVLEAVFEAFIHQTQVPLDFHARVMAQVHHQRARRGLVGRWRSKLAPGSTWFWPWEWSRTTATPRTQLHPGWRRLGWNPLLATLLLLSLGGNLVWLRAWLVERSAGMLHSSASVPVDGTRRGQGALFNTYAFQTGLQSATELGTLAATHTVLEAPPQLLGLAPSSPHAAFVRMGMQYAEAIAFLHSSDLERATQRLALLAQTLDTVPAPRRLAHYLTEIRTWLHDKKYVGQEMATFVGLFEQLYAESYGEASSPEARTLFRAGTWLVNIALAAAAGDRTALRQGDTAAWLSHELTQLNVPYEVLTALERVRHLMTQPQITDADRSEILTNVKTMQRLIGA